MSGDRKEFLNRATRLSIDLLSIDLARTCPQPAKRYANRRRSRPIPASFDPCQDEAADDEYLAMMRFAGLDATGLHRVRLTHRSLGSIDFARWSGIILGGGPYNVSDAGDSKSTTQQRVESELLPLIGRIVDRDFPFLGCCYGVGTLG